MKSCASRMLKTVQISQSCIFTADALFFKLLKLFFADFSIYLMYDICLCISILSCCSHAAGLNAIQHLIKNTNITNILIL